MKLFIPALYKYEIFSMEHYIVFGHCFKYGGKWQQLKRLIRVKSPKLLKKTFT